MDLIVHGATGHWGLPGQVDQGGFSPSLPMPPLSTVRGFLESLLGLERGGFGGRVAWGWLRRPAGHGWLVRRASVWSSSGNSAKETIRSVSVEVWFDWQLVVRVQGKLEDELRSAMRGDRPRYGVLCLGESQDMVQVFEREVSDEDVGWICPVGEEEPGYLLPVQSGQGYGSMTTRYGRFAVKPGQASWSDIRAER